MQTSRRRRAMVETANFRVVEAPRWGLEGRRYGFLNFYSNSWTAPKTIALVIRNESEEKLDGSR